MHLDDGRERTSADRPIQPRQDRLAAFAAIFEVAGLDLVALLDRDLVSHFASSCAPEPAALYRLRPWPALSAGRAAGARDLMSARQLARGGPDEDYRCLADPVRLGQHPADDLWPSYGAADRQQRPRPAADRDRRGHRRPRLSRHLLEPGEPRRARVDPLP